VPAWPISLPQTFLVESLRDFRRQRQSLHHPTDVGPGISRQRTTAYSEFFSGQMHMTPDQYDTLVAFYDQTLLGGALAFDWQHPLTGDPKSIKFNLLVEDHLNVVAVERPDLWRVHMAFEILP
jgi:hypothetical protein